MIFLPSSVHIESLVGFQVRFSEIGPRPLQIHPDLRKKEELIYDTKVEEAFETLPEGGDIVLAHRWENVVKHIDSPNENDWKQAILEADIILDELLTKMGYRGESVGEKLKRVESGDFKTVQDAWEAHKVRNQIAHTPGFTLNKIEAQQTYQLYKKVLDEFYYI